MERFARTMGNIGVETAKGVLALLRRWGSSNCSELQEVYAPAGSLEQK